MSHYNLSDGHVSTRSEKGPKGSARTGLVAFAPDALFENGPEQRQGGEVLRTAHSLLERDQIREIEDLDRSRADREHAGGDHEIFVGSRLASRSPSHSSDRGITSSRRTWAPLDVLGVVAGDLA